MSRPIGILGGTFDPIHHGHLRLAIELYERLNLREVRFLPAAQPPLRSIPIANAQQRLAMVSIAITDVAGLTVDDRELHRSTPSYTVDTLRSLRADYPTQSFCLILGMDAFLKLPQWYQWEQLITLAHLLIVHRPNQVLPRDHYLTDFLKKHQISQPTLLSQQTHGTIFIVEIPALDISATQIRHALITGKDPRFLLPSTVLAFIEQYQLYR